MLTPEERAREVIDAWVPECQYSVNYPKYCNSTFSREYPFVEFEWFPGKHAFIRGFETMIYYCYFCGVAGAWSPAHDRAKARPA